MGREDDDRRSRSDRDRDRDRERARSKEREKDRTRERDRERIRNDVDDGRRERESRGRREDPASAELAGGTEATEGTGGEISLSVEETNKLRAKLGLRPLDEGPSRQQEEAERWRAEKEQAEKDKQAKELMDKIFEAKQRREMKTKLAAVKGLGEASDDDADDVMAWVDKSRKKEEAKKQAEKQAKMFEEMDDEFGVSSLVEEEVKKEEYKAKQQAYTGRDLKGLKVEHGVEEFTEGATILTLKDQGVLDDVDDVLENVNMLDDSKAKENVEKKKAKPVYTAYDDDEFDEHGNPRQERSILQQYDEEIDGKKAKAFMIGDSGVAMEDREEAERRRVLANLKKQALNASTVALAPRAETLTQDEVAFKKPTKKKVRKVRKKGGDDEEMVRPGDLIPMEELNGAVGRKIKKENDMDVDPSTPPAPEAAFRAAPRIIEEDDDDDTELQAALERTRRLRVQQTSMAGPEARLSHLLNKVKEEPANVFVGDTERVVISAQVESIRTLGDTPDGMVERQRSERERAVVANRNAKGDETEPAPDAMDVDGTDTKNKVKREEDEHFTLIEEKNLAKGGLAAALAFAAEKGFIEKNKNDGQAGYLLVDDDRKKALRAQQEEDYRTERERERDKYRHRGKQNEQQQARDSRDDDRRMAGGEFKEKEGYVPSVDIKYFDKWGFELTQKDAFRDLSQRFHGKALGKNKVEKYLRKRQEEIELQKMDNTDTPLNTMMKLKEKQAATGSAYIVLPTKGAAAPQESISLQKDTSKRKADGATKAAKKKPKS